MVCGTYCPSTWRRPTPSGAEAAGRGIGHAHGSQAPPHSPPRVPAGRSPLPRSLGTLSLCVPATPRGRPVTCRYPEAGGEGHLPLPAVPDARRCRTVPGAGGAPRPCQAPAGSVPLLISCARPAGPLESPRALSRHAGRFPASGAVRFRPASPAGTAHGTPAGPRPPVHTPPAGAPPVDLRFREVRCDSVSSAAGYTTVRRRTALAVVAAEPRTAASARYPETRLPSPHPYCGLVPPTSRRSARPRTWLRRRPPRHGDGGVVHRCSPAFGGVRWGVRRCFRVPLAPGLLSVRPAAPWARDSGRAVVCRRRCCSFMAPSRPESGVQEGDRVCSFRAGTAGAPSGPAGATAACKAGPGACAHRLLARRSPRCLPAVVELGVRRPLARSTVWPRCSPASGAARSRLAGACGCRAVRG